MENTKKGGNTKKEEIEEITKIDKTRDERYIYARYLCTTYPQENLKGFAKGLQTVNFCLP